MSKSLKFYLLSNTSNSVRKYHFQNFTDDLLTTKPPLSLNWKDFLLFYQLDLLPNKSCHSLCTESFPKIDTTKLTVLRTNIAFPFSIVTSINRNFARPFPSSQWEHRSAFSSQVERRSDCVAYMKNLMKNFDDLNVIKWTQMCYVIFINKVYFFENKIISLWMLLT